MITSINEWSLFKKKLDNREKFDLILDTIYKKIDNENIFKITENKVVILDRLNNYTIELYFYNGLDKEIGITIRQYNSDYILGKEIFPGVYFTLDSVLDFVNNEKFNTSFITNVFKYNKFKHQKISI